MVVHVFILEIAGHNLEGVLGPLVLSFYCRGAQLVIPHLLVFCSLHSESCSTELFREQTVFESNGTVLT